MVEKRKKKSCLSLSIFTLGLIWVRTKDEECARIVLALPRVLLLLLGEGKYNFRSKHYISYLISDGTTVQETS